VRQTPHRSRRANDAIDKVEKNRISRLAALIAGEGARGPSKSGLGWCYLKIE
jgi:hypothetical protein